MLTTVVTTFLLIFTVAYGRVLLYNTENNQAVERFDCVYHIHDDGEEIPYCRRLNGSYPLDRNKKECMNQGKRYLLRDLIDRNVQPNEVLKWSSSVEMADLYTSFFNNRSLIDDNDDQFICNCSTAGTFGKYCEYQLTHEKKSFSETIKAQFKQKEDGDSWDTQRYGKILCYETLRCPSSPLCLDWREICDGKQRCVNGTDEENCDKLEFNECEDNEFRCANGMCISEEFWLDSKYYQFWRELIITLIAFTGEYDCMDWSDEYHHDAGKSCPREPSAIECDEHLCSSKMYSCGDGECVPWETRMVFQRLAKAQNDCFNKRNLNYMCEVSPHRSAWTLESGLCWPDKDYDDSRYPPWNMINTSKLTDSERCQYLFRCVLSKGFENNCPCSHRNCTKMMMSVCSRPDRLILFPSPGLIDPNILIFYNYSYSMENPTFQLFRLFGGIKCRGYFYQAKQVTSVLINIHAISNLLLNNALCTIDDPAIGYRDLFSPHQNGKFCWNDSLTFNGHPYAVNPDICTRSGECISQYRIRDGSTDCFDQEDEKKTLNKDYCIGNVGRHRFQCFNDQRKCLHLYRLGTGMADCSNNYDESWYGTGTDIRHQLSCFKALKVDCHLAKKYIQQSSNRNSSDNSSLDYSQEQEPTDRTPFRYYCNSFWNLEKHVDEMFSSCQYWICQTHQYQCRTGQCIELEWVCDGEWDCYDASDEEAILLIEKWSKHNARLLSLPTQLEKCRKRYSKSPFSNICNTSFEFGCYLSGISDPLDIESNRPCINLTQIGDGVEDCYNAYDEKNTFTSISQFKGMWGFHFRCGNLDIIYPDACDRLRNCSQILCSQYRATDGSCSDPKDFICIGDDHCKKNAWCNEIVDCFYGEDEYWCPYGTIDNQRKYRHDKKRTSLRRGEPHPQIMYPPKDMLKANQRQLSNYIINLQNDEFFKVYSYQCNRGIAVLEMNQIRCLCPPAYYGDWCQFFSDRISIIARVDHKTELKTISNRTLKIKANFLFNNRTIDHHEFHVIPIMERTPISKHKFYLLYSRSPEMLAHKQNRYFNRSDLINHHPYSVHFDVFVLEKNNSIEEIGSWHYPIYFDYLPAFRLAVTLAFGSWSENAILDLCQQNICNVNSTCIPVFNQNNSYYCSCKSGYYGTNCSMYQPLCKTYCSINALCRIDDPDLQEKKKKPYCICPLGRFGLRCNLNYDDSDSNSCLNNGTYLTNYDPSGENPYLCMCSKQFEGFQCQNEKVSVNINFNISRILSTRVTIVQFFAYHITSFLLVIQQQQIFIGLPPVIRHYHSAIIAPPLAVLKIYEGLTLPQYFLIYFLHQSKINITSSPQHCPHASLLLYEGQFFHL